MAYGLLYDFLMGQSTRAYEYFGAHFIEYQTKEDAPHKKGRKNNCSLQSLRKIFAVFTVREWDERKRGLEMKPKKLIGELYIQSK